MRLNRRASDHIRLLLDREDAYAVLRALVERQRSGLSPADLAVPIALLTEALQGT